MFQKSTRVAAWACLGFIVYATLSSAAARPELTTSEPALVVVVERLGAYGLLGLLFCLGYPRRITVICLIVFGSAILLELLQLLTPDRDARLIDAVEKLTGGAAGIFAGRAFIALAGRLGWNI
jgi:VanZ family protein